MNEPPLVREPSSIFQRLLAARWLRWSGLLAGLGLLIASIVVVLGNGELFRNAMVALRSPPPLCAAVLVGSILANIVLSGLMFSLLVSRYGKVGLGEMQALIAASALLNFLPLRPGLLGRVAYHKAVNGIALADSARVLVEALVISVVGAVWMIASVPIAGALELSPWWVAAAPAPALIIGGLHPRARRLLAAALMRHVELLIWAARYWAVFAMIGSPIDAQTSMVLASVSITATLVPFLSNGLGLREWAIGAAGPLLNAYLLDLGLTAELVNRAAEMAVFLVAGLIGLAWLARHRRMARAAASLTD